MHCLDLRMLRYAGVDSRQRQQDLTLQSHQNHHSVAAVTLHGGGTEALHCDGTEALRGGTEAHHGGCAEELWSGWRLKDVETPERVVLQIQRHLEHKKVHQLEMENSAVLQLQYHHQEGCEQER